MAHNGSRLAHATHGSALRPALHTGLYVHKITQLLALLQILEIGAGQYVQGRGELTALHLAPYSFRSPFAHLST